MSQVILRAMVASLIAAASVACATAACAQAAPSFDCSKARELDEVAICADARLAQVEAIYSGNVAKRHGGRREAAEALTSRHGCGNDRLCILDELKGGLDGVVPSWVAGYRRQLVREVANDDLRAKSYAKMRRPQSFTTSAHGVQATLVQLEGLDTSHATARGVVTPADDREECLRNAPSDHVSSRVECTRHLPGIARSFASSADCGARTVTMWDGIWRIRGFDGETLSWLSPDGDVGPAWEGRSTPDQHFDLLCPNTLARLRAQAVR